MAIIVGDIHGNVEKVQAFLEFRPDQEHIREAIGREYFSSPPVFDQYIGLQKKDFGVSFIETGNRSDKISTVLRVYNELVTYGEVQLISASNNTCCIFNELLANDHQLAREYERLPCLTLELSVIGRPQKKRKATIGDPIVSDHRVSMRVSNPC